MLLGKVKPSYVYLILKPYFGVSSPPQSRSQAVVCASTPRKYPRSGYFLANTKVLECTRRISKIFPNGITISAPLKPRGSIFQNGFLGGIHLPGVIIEMGFY